MAFFRKNTHVKDNTGYDEENRFLSHNERNGNGGNFNLDAILSSEPFSSPVNANSQPGTFYNGAHRRRPIRAGLSETPPQSPGKLLPHASPLWDDVPSPMVTRVRRRGPRFPSLQKQCIPFCMRILFATLVFLMFWGPMLMQMQNYQSRDESQPQIFQQIYSHTLKTPILGKENTLKHEKHSRHSKRQNEGHNTEQEKGGLSKPVLSALRAVQNLDYFPGRETSEDETGEEDFTLDKLSEKEKEELKIGNMKRPLPRAWQEEEQKMENEKKQKKEQESQKEQLRLQQSKLLEQQHLIERQLLHEAEAIAAQRKQIELNKKGTKTLKPIPPNEDGESNKFGNTQQSKDAPFTPILQNFHVGQNGTTQRIIEQQLLHEAQMLAGQKKHLELQMHTPDKANEAFEQNNGKLDEHLINSQSMDKPQLSQQPKLDVGGGYNHGTAPQMIPALLQETFADIWTPMTSQEVPLFWHIPKNGGTTVADILTHCLDLVSASNIGATEGYGSEPNLQVRQYADKGRYVNVNAATPEGMERAKKLGLVSSGLADVIVTHRLHLGAELYDSNHQARVFAMFRHPVKRATSMFFYLQQAKWEPTYDHSLAELTLEQYAVSGKAEENWVTRFLTHEYTSPLTELHVTMAKEIMRRKVIVGLLDRFGESLKRFELYFDWWRTKIRPDAEEKMNCQQKRALASQNHFHHSDATDSSVAYQRLAKLNWADMELYDYAIQLFDEQQALVNGKDASLTSDYRRGQEPRIY